MAVLVTAVAPPAATAAGAAVNVQVLQDTGDRIVIRYQVGDYTISPVDIGGYKYAQISLENEPLIKERGSPELPRVCRSIIIPDDAKMAVEVVQSDYQEIEAIDVVPSKGFLPRTVNPEDVPYAFGDVYTVDAFYPADLASLREAYILRDYRGTVIELNPFQYNPVTQTLRVYTDVTLEVLKTGTDTVNVLDRKRPPAEMSLAFHQIYKQHFLNFAPPLRYAPLDETGDMRIICHDAWLPNIQPLVSHKNARGISTTAVGVSTIGNNATAIKTYIQNVYNTSDLAFVLLVGDGAQVDTPVASGGSSDPSYSKLAGSDDYPDILVGRFSAETPAHVDTQVLRTIEYEQLPAPTQDWFKRGTGIASNQGPGDDGEYDNQHMDNIRADLLAYGYTLVDQIYDPTATAAQVTSALNNGRGIVNYCGHGSITSWSSSGFSNTHVNALVNDNMLPFIFSVACVNGRFDGYTCFGEAWLRATNGTEPTGAIGAYMSSINQTWNPPMCAQDESVDLLVAETYVSFGTLCFAGSCQMIDEYGAGGVDMFNTWIVFGDPSLRIIVTCSRRGTIFLHKDKYKCEGTATIQVSDCDLNLDPGVVDTVTVTAESDSEPAGETLLLSETGQDTAEFEGAITLSEINSSGVLLVAEGDTVTATYIDLDDGQGGSNVTVTDTAVVDCTPPVLSNVQVLDVQPRSATISIDGDEPILGSVFYGDSCSSLPGKGTSIGYATTAVVQLSGLQDNSTYYFAVHGEDEAGNYSWD
ncbi:MAG: hypothetical protein JSV19_00145, partial [Phycisphaerales bacterium]